MASLTGQRIKDTYQSLLKTNDNGQITSVYKNITDGVGDSSGLYLKDNGVLISGSLTVTEGITGSLFGTASWAENSLFAISSSNSATASSADNFFVRNSITASSILVADTITAKSLVVEIVSSSIVYSSGSNIFGDELIDKQTFTGSVDITGSLSVNGSTAILSDQTSSMSVLSASYADTASYAVNAISASYISGSAAIVTNLTSSNDANINGLTVGRGNSAVSSNTVLGIDAGRVFSSTTTSNVAVGWRSLYNLNGAGSYANTAVGVFSLLNNTAGIGNTAVGTSAAVLSIGSYNTAIGVNALARASSGDYNIWLGYSAAPGGVFTSGFYNTIIGSQINLGVSTLSNNIIIADGQGNIKYRWDATQNNIYGNLAVTGSVTATLGFTGSLFGTASWAENAISASYVSGSAAIVTNLTGSNDALINGVTVGRGYSSTFQNNTVLGETAFVSNTAGSSNTAVGYLSLTTNTTGQSNTAIGAQALRYNQTATNSTAIGRQALLNITSGQVNIGIGVLAGSSFTSGDYNIHIGTSLGGGLGITNGSYNVILGNQISGLPSTLNNNVIISDGQGNIKYRWDTIQNNFNGNLVVTGSITATQNITASNALITGTVTAQTLIVQTVTSSVIYSSGSNIFGNDITNQQTFTGSVNVTGSLTVNGSTIINTTNGYFLPPTMNESQRTSLGVVPVGSIVYQTDGMEGVYVYTSTGWRSLTMV
jgi:hypothetical protein